MSTRSVATSLMFGMILSLVAPFALSADEAPVVVYAKEPSKVRIRTSEIQSWTSDSDTSMVVTTKRRDQFRIDFAHSCFNLRQGPRSNALVTEHDWLDRNSHIRLLDRDRLPFGQLDDGRSGDISMRINSYSSLCAIQDITALGKKPRAARAHS